MLASSPIDRFMHGAIEEKHSSYIGIVRIKPDGSRERVLPREEDAKRYRIATQRVQELDITGTTVAHVFSVTKSMLGLAWASALWQGQTTLEPTQLYMDITEKNNTETETSEYRKSEAGYYLSPTRPVTRTLPLLLHAKVRWFFSQSTGLHTIDFGASQALTTMLLAKRRHIRDVETFNGLLAENFIISRPAKGGDVFNYDNLLTQVAGFMLEDYEKSRRGDPTFLIRDLVLSRFFPDELKTPEKNKYIRDGWPLLEAGYRFYGIRDGAIVEYCEMVKNTMVLAGLRMTGRDMEELGINLLKNHRPLLEKIYADTELGLTLSKHNSPTISERAGWRYSLFFWIPVFENDTEHRWISCIGHQGQYILMELATQTVFVRQHFNKAPAIENIDAAHISVAAADEYRYPNFARDCMLLLKEIQDKQ